MWRIQQYEFHFTTDNDIAGLKKLWFKGYVEELPAGTIQRFKGIRLWMKIFG
jgi:hypothetical protein